jgi:hypothetical protein
MGYYRLPWERDAELRSLTYRTRGDLLAAEKLVKWAIEKGYPEPAILNQKLRMAWKHLLLGEVSDSTGQQPFPVEIEYTRRECDDCQRYLLEILLRIKSTYQIPKHFIVTSNQDKVEFCDEKCPHHDVEGPAHLNDIISFFKSPPTLLHPNRAKSSFRISRVNDEYSVNDQHFILNLTLQPRSYTPFFKRVLAFFRDGEKNQKFAQLYDHHIGNYVGIRFPLWENKIIYSPACMEDTLKTHNLDAFAFKRTWLPLPNGIIGLGNDTYIVKHNMYGDTHIACILNFEEPPYSADFLVLNPPTHQKFSWQFSLFKGSQEDVLDLANKLNVFPTQKI